MRTSKETLEVSLYLNLIKCGGQFKINSLLTVLDPFLAISEDFNFKIFPDPLNWL